MGTYELMSRPRAAEGVERKSAWLVGGGVASLAAAVFLIRDAQMDGSHVHILEETALIGGALDGAGDAEHGYVVRGGREIEEHYECTWDLFSSIPSLDEPGASVLTEFRRLNAADPSSSPVRVIERGGQDAHTDGKLGLDHHAQREITRLFLAKEEDLGAKTIAEYFSPHFLGSPMWLYWRSMFAFQEWHSVAEMKRYLQRFIHLVDGLGWLLNIKYFRYNQYESVVEPLVAWLSERGVDFRRGVQVTDLDVDRRGEALTVTGIRTRCDGVDDVIHVTADDLVMVTNGSMTEGSRLGSDDTQAELYTGPAGCWDLWKKLAAKDARFGRPEVFCGDVEKTLWESFTVTCRGPRIPDRLKAITGRDPLNGRIVTGGPCTIRDSSWLLTFTVSRQPHFRNQPPGVLVLWAYGLFSDVPGDHVPKTMRECTGAELLSELLFHLGVPVAEIPGLVSATTVIPAMMPYITAQFMPRVAGDRPDVVPKGSVNLAFLGQFAEVPKDCVFTVEYSVRTAMTAVYELLGVDRQVPEVHPSMYDLRDVMRASRTLQGDDPIRGAGLARRFLRHTQFDGMV